MKNVVVTLHVLLVYLKVLRHVLAGVAVILGNEVYVAYAYKVGVFFLEAERRLSDVAASAVSLYLVLAFTEGHGDSLAAHL